MLCTWKLDLRLLKDILILYTLQSCIFYTYCHAWLPDASTKVINHVGQIPSIKFIGNTTRPDHFIVLNQDDNSIILGGRNTVYNLSIHDLSEHKEWRITWPSSEAHSQLCQLKGKSEDDCQNFIRILVSLTPNLLLVCGTNSYKPLCRHYLLSVITIMFIQI